MKFIIRRASHSGTKLPPCEEAVWEQHLRVDERTYDAPEKIPAGKGKSAWWYEDGENHRVKNGHIVRDFPDASWFVSIEALEDLVALAEKYGDVVFSLKSWANPNIPQLIIYDDYLE